MTRTTSPSPLRRVTRSLRAAHRRNSNEWIRRIEAPPRPLI